MSKGYNDVRCRMKRSWCGFPQFFAAMNPRRSWLMILARAGLASGISMESRRHSSNRSDDFAQTGPRGQYCCRGSNHRHCPGVRRRGAVRLPRTGSATLLEGQEGWAISAGYEPRHREVFLTMAFSMVSSLHMPATKATFFDLPASSCL